MRGEGLVDSYRGLPCRQENGNHGPKIEARIPVGNLGPQPERGAAVDDQSGADVQIGLNTSR